MRNKKVKIGILTLSSSDNCGSLLQAYALQKKVMELGYQYVEVIDFQSDTSKRLYDIFPYDILKQPRKLVSTILNYKKIRKQKDDYNLFREKQLQLSNEKYKTVNDMEKVGENYDIVVCGSDQIWNVCMYDFSEAFFLPYVCNVKKIAYAASLGGESFKKYAEIDKLEQWISDFSKISVREKEGKKEVCSVFAGEVEVLVDPTLLLSTEEWMQIAGHERIVEEDYIFYYSWSYNDKELMRIVQKISKMLKKKVYVINASKWLFQSYKKYGFHLCEEGGPYAFLNLIRYADLVLVESLHGTIFSTIYQKKFWYLNGCKNGKIDSRNQYLLDLLGLSERVIEIDEEFSIADVEKSVLYNRNVEQVKTLIDYSIVWLMKAIEE